MGIILEYSLLLNSIRHPRNMKRIALIGAASGWGAQLRETEQGPDIVKALGLEDILLEEGLNAYWRTTVRPSKTAKDIQSLHPKDAIDLVNEHNQRLANIVRQSLKENEFPVVIGGDHSIAVGNWGAIASETNAIKNFGLIWIDAHMDSHTLETSPSFAYHGMPVAALLGHGEASFVDIVSPGAKIKPENMVLLGVRSYEPPEEALLKKLGVRVIKMAEIKKIGFAKAFDKALKIAKTGVRGFGVSIDLDGFDPEFAPGVGSPVTGGLNPKEVIPCFKKLARQSGFLGLEIVELNPSRDLDNKTASIARDIILTIFLD